MFQAEVMYVCVHIYTYIYIYLFIYESFYNPAVNSACQHYQHTIYTPMTLPSFTDDRICFALNFQKYPFSV